VHPIIRILCNYVTQEAQPSWHCYLKDEFPRKHPVYLPYAAYGKNLFLFKENAAEVFKKILN